MDSGLGKKKRKIRGSQRERGGMQGRQEKAEKIVKSCSATDKSV